MPGRGVPDSVAVPSRWSTRVTPAGKVPVLPIFGVGLPVAVTVKAPAVPAVKEAVLALVIAGARDTVAVAVTVKVKDWMASGRTPLAAVIVSR